MTVSRVVHQKSLDRSNSVLRDTTDAVFTIPNLLTAVRLALAVLAAYLFVVHRFQSQAVAFCLVGMILDAVDGWYARRFNQCSNLGRFLDPLVDKFLIGVVYFAIAVNLDSLIVWMLLGLVIARDVIVTITRSLYYHRNGVAMASDRWGKLKMIVQSVCGLALLTYAYVFGGGFDALYYPALFVLLIITILSFVSGARSMWGNGLVRMGSRKPVDA